MPYWTHASPQHVQNATRLETGQRNRSLVDDTLNAESQEGTLDVAAALQLQAVVDLPIARCRPSIFVFINSLVRNSPRFCFPLELLDYTSTSTISGDLKMKRLQGCIAIRIEKLANIFPACRMSPYR